MEQWINKGWKISRSELIDSLEPGPIDQYPIPFPFAYYDWQSVYDENDPSFDYAVYPLSQYYRRLLVSNGVEALNEDVWEKQPTAPDTFFLLGNPEEFFTETPEGVMVPSLLHYITPIYEKPEGFDDTEIQLFYGEINLPDGLNSIRGESGGPILAFQENEKGEYRYWLIAIQSRWLPNSRIIAACSTKIFGEAVRGFYRLDSGQ